MHKIIMDTFATRDRWQNLPYQVRRGRDELGTLFFENDMNRGAEIGVRKGDFSIVLCKANPNIEYYCIDPWEGYAGFSQERQDSYYETARKRLEPYNANIMRMRSLDALKEFDDRYLDFVFIDGNHKFDWCCMDIIMWSKKVRRGGIVACHDFTFLPADVGEAVRAYTHAHRIDPWYLTKEPGGTAFWVNP